MSDAVSLLEEKRFEELRGVLLAKLEAGEDTADLFWLLTLAYFGLEALDRALLALSESLKRDAHHAERWRLLGALFTRLGAFSLASEAYKSALDIEPSDTLALSERLALRHRRDTLELDEESRAHWSRIPGYAHPTLTACLIVKNEERNLPACLSSIRPYVDEIVLVDTGSTDRTVEIAGQYGARVFHFQWNDDFSAARNLSLEHATGEWVLIIDADERLLPLDAGRLRRQLRNREAQCVEISCHNVDADGNRLDSFPAARMFLRHPDVRYSGRVHNTLGPAFVRQGYKKTTAPWIELEHHGFISDEMRRAGKFERGLRLTRREIEEHPGRPESWMHYMRMAMAVGDADEARRAMAQIAVLEKAGCRLESAQRRYFHFLSAIFFKEAGEESVFCKSLEQGLAEFPAAPELLFEKAMGAVRRGEIRQALEQFERILMPEPSASALPPAPVLAGVDGYGAALEAVSCAELLGDLKRSYFYTMKALEDPALPQALRPLLTKKLEGMRSLSAS